MKSCNRVTATVVLILVMCAGCGADAPDYASMAVPSIGAAPTSATPMLGEAVAPVGGAGGDGAAVVTQVGGWSGGPGAVRWHGGQWVIPYSAQPGAVIQSVFCDVVPRADATALVELVGATGVLGSMTVPATTANVVIRAWLGAAGHIVADGEPLVFRLSPRDATTGVWTGPDKDMTVIGCAVSTMTTHTAFYHVSSGSSIVVGGQVPTTGPYSTQLLVGSNTEVQYPLNTLESAWNITAVRLYMAQTPVGTPTYDLVSDGLSSTFGVTGFQPIAGTATSTGAVVVDLPITTGVPVTGPLHVHVKTNASSTTALGAIQITYTTGS